MYVGQEGGEEDAKLDFLGVPAKLTQWVVLPSLYSSSHKDWKTSLKQLHLKEGTWLQWAEWSASAEFENKMA